MDPDSRWRSIFSKKLEVQVLEAFSYFRGVGLNPILVKGWAAARNYPAEFPRYYTDIDLAFSKTDYEIAKFLMDEGRDIHFSVDLHCELRHLDTKLWNDLFADSLLVELDGSEIRIPSYEDHLRILAVHWLSDGGAHKEKLWDIYYAVQNRPRSFDWEKCLNSVSQVRQKWIIATIGLANKYLGLEIDELPFATKAKELPDWLVATVEAEWNSNVKLKSLNYFLHSPKELVRQIRKRIPPNPIQATVEMEGRFDDGLRIGYQVRSIIRRTPASFRSIVRAFRHRN